MDPDNNKNEGKKCWLRRFLKGSRRGQASASLDTSSSELDRDNGAQDSTLSRDMVSCASTRNSFRRSFRKMQTSVKSCISGDINLKNNVLTSRVDIVIEPRPPPVPPRVMVVRHNALSKNVIRRHNPTDEILNLSLCCWYWGPMTTHEAEEVLKYKPDGTFLVRDSSSTSYLFSMSFRSVGRTMHSRIEYSRGLYNLYGACLEGFPTVTELIQSAMKISEYGVCSYSSFNNGCVQYPVRLTKPYSRFTGARSLKFLCKYVIRQCTNINDISKLPLPTTLYDYLLEGPYV